MKVNLFTHILQDFNLNPNLYPKDNVTFLKGEGVKQGEKFFNPSLSLNIRSPKANKIKGHRDIISTRQHFFFQNCRTKFIIKLCTFLTLTEVWVLNVKSLQPILSSPSDNGIFNKQNATTSARWEIEDKNLQIKDCF